MMQKLQAMYDQRKKEKEGEKKQEESKGETIKV
jgi:hypothetical protein